VILREAFADILPPEIDRRGKMGFGVPLGTWFRGELKEYLCDHLLDSNARYRTYLRADTVHSLVRRHLAGEINGANRLWTVLCFERWLRLLEDWRHGGVTETAASMPAASRA
jgi:asparagine synthase (glutamine-hydrolysing)